MAESRRSGKSIYGTVQSAGPDGGRSRGMCAARPDQHQLRFCTLDVLYRAFVLQRAGVAVGKAHESRLSIPRDLYLEQEYRHELGNGGR